MNQTASEASAKIYSPELARAIGKVKWRVLPLFVIMFIANYIDRVNIGFVRPHLSADLGIGAAAFGFGAGLFFVGYALFEVPSNMMLQRFGAKAWLTRIMATWGIAATAMAFVQGEMSFYALRFLLGVAEAGFFPGVVYYFTRWLPRAERGKAMAVFLSGSAAASILSGPVSGGLLQVEGMGLHGWQWMFIIEGLFSVLLCGAVWFILDSDPKDAKWLSDVERNALVGEIASEQKERESQQLSHASAWTLLRDSQIALFCLIYFLISLTIYGTTFWLPTIIKKMGHYTEFQVGLFNSIPWIISIVAMYVFAALAQRFKFQQGWAAAAFAVAGVGMFASASTANPVYGFVAICFAAIGFKAASSLFWPIPQSYLDVRIAAAVIALINSLGNLGGFVAPAAFGMLEQRTGSIQGGLYGLAIASLLGAVVVFFARNRPKKGAPGTPATVAG
ncbi:MFS transporter [Herbaspirillum sp. SJZ107]|uniref:MFS transporter n=1 Tax=Herbaspirillum sp. SJZ107 TaxID=2572881 RepID=UPI001174E6AE|nr:MFS transporter [Herbaspirillum sp. SJZ107]TQK11931.1 sugar phosphate permease [Herbaspirillum sp. SJZ107]